MTINELREIYEKTLRGELPQPEDTIYVNNHIHTTYSFSPYNPTDALYMAWQNGLKTAGIMDHDSAAGCREFLAAAEVIGMPVTCGVECRVDMSMTALNGKRINNPDQKSVAYVAMHGIPHQNIEKVDAFFAPYREKRNQRNREMCENITELVKPYGLSLDFDADVLPLSNYAKGGSVTERHILYALAKKITAIYKTPAEVVSFLVDEMKLALSQKVIDQMRTPCPPDAHSQLSAHHMPTLVSPREGARALPTRCPHHSAHHMPTLASPLPTRCMPPRNVVKRRIRRKPPPRNRIFTWFFLCTPHTIYISGLESG